MGDIILVFIAIVQLMFFFFHLFEYEVIVTIFNVTKPGTLLALQIVLGALSVSFILSSIIESYYNNLATRIFYRISAVWLGFLLYLMMAEIVFYVVLAALLPFGVSLHVITFIGKVLLGLALLVTVYGLFNARRMTVTALKLKLDGLPEAWKGRKAVWVSDLQLGQVYGRQFSQSVVDKINGLDPDIVFVGGDLYDGVKVDLDDVIAPFRAMHPPLGTYFINGNHEEFSDNTKYLEAVRRAGMKTLVDESVDIDGLELVGVDYGSTITRSVFKTILSRLTKNKDKCYMLLKHSPSHVKAAEEAGISFMISGHTHHAQMAPLNMLTSLIYNKYDFGLRKSGKMVQYTSSGVGTWGPPLRVGNKSEIVLITFV